MNKFFKLLLLIAVIALVSAPALFAQKVPIGGTSGSISSKDNQQLSYDATSGALSIQRGNAVTLTNGTDNQQLSYDASTGALQIQRGNTVTINTTPPANVWRTGGNPGPYNGQNTLGWLTGQSLNIFAGGATAAIFQQTANSGSVPYLQLPHLTAGRRLVIGGFYDLPSTPFHYNGFGMGSSSRSGGLDEFITNVWSNSTDFVWYASDNLTPTVRNERFRITGTGRVSVNQTNASSTFEVNGSQGANYVKLSGATTLADNYYVWADGATNYLVTLPSAASCPRRAYVIRCTNVNKTISNYFDRTNATNNVLKAGEITTLVSDGSSWLQF